VGKGEEKIALRSGKGDEDLILFKKIFKNFTKIPFNAVRVFALRRAGYEIGEDVWVGKDLCVVDDNTGEEKLVVGNRVAIAPRVIVILQSYPNFSRIKSIAPTKRGNVVIKDDAWIGAGAIILPGIEIGEGAVVGAGAVVTKSVPPYTIVAGCPAREIGKLPIASLKQARSGGNAK
jgi:acetyltransferase-like isoleucine patch superfamily enzyme